MTRIFVFATLAFLAASCSSGKGKDASVESVKHVLKASHLRPQKVKVITTIQTTARTPLPSVNYCAAEAVAQPSATSLDVEHGRATVMVFESRHDANDWTPLPECGAKPFRVRNVIAVPTHGRLSERLRQALHRLQ